MGVLKRVYLSYRLGGENWRDDVMLRKILVICFNDSDRNLRHEGWGFHFYFCMHYLRIPHFGSIAQLHQSHSRISISIMYMIFNPKPD